MSAINHVKQNINRMPTKPSTYLALFFWGVEAFTTQPTIGSFVAHFLVAPIFLFLLIWMAHWEGTNSRDEQ